MVARLHDDVAKVLAMPDVRKDLVAKGADPGDMSGAEFGRFIAEEQAKWAKLVKDAGIVMDEVVRGAHAKGVHCAQRRGAQGVNDACGRRFVRTQLDDIASDRLRRHAQQVALDGRADVDLQLPVADRAGDARVGLQLEPGP